MHESHKRLQGVYGSTTNKELEERYDQWATDYNKDVAEEFAWNSPQTATDIFSKHVDTSAKILDAGAGTGLVGECLVKAGYGNLVAMDLSLGMLQEAKGKKVYTDVHQMALGEPLDFPTDEFDAVVSVGVFTQGHAPASSFNELVRVTKPGGMIVFSLSVDTHETGGFKEHQSSLEGSGKWELTEVTEKFQPLPKGEPDVWHQIWAYRVMPN